MAGRHKDTGSPQEQPAAARRWSGRSIGSGWQHHVFYALIRLAGRGGAHLLLVCVVLYYTLLRPSVRARSLPYLTRRFPGRTSRELFWDSYRLNLGIGQVLVDRAVLGILGPGSMKISISRLPELQALLAEGRGLLLVTAHVGSWQVAMHCLENLGTGVSLLLHRDAGESDRQFFEHRAGGAPFRIIDPAGYLGGTLEMLGVLKQQEVLCIMGDRAMGGESGTVGVDFLGAPIELPFSPYKLASATGTPIAVIFPHCTPGGGYAMQIARVIRVPENLGRSPAAYRPYAAQFAAALEEFVAQYPYQFFNFFNMWSPVGAGGPGHEKR